MRIRGRRPDKALESWLRAESSGRSEEAEEALAELFSRLPRPHPGMGFAEQVLARTDLVRSQTAAAGAGAFAGLWLRWAVGTGLLLAALSFLAVPAVMRPLADPVDLFGALGTVLAAFGKLVVAVASGLTFWHKLADLAHGAAAQVATPVGVAALCCTALTAAIAFRLLSEQIGRERRASYVDAR